MQALQSRAAVLDPLRWTPSDHRLRLRSSAAVRSEATGVRRKHSVTNQLCLRLDGNRMC